MLAQNLSPGDTVVLTAAVRDLHASHPGQFAVDVRTTAQPLWAGNDFLTPLGIEPPKDLADRAVVSGIECVRVHYPAVHWSNRSGRHFIDGVEDYLEEALHVRIRNRHVWGDVRVLPAETHCSPLAEWIGPQYADRHYWIVVAGGKFDFTAKIYDPYRLQRVVEARRDMLFVQVGELSHLHWRLEGENVIDLLGRTDVRGIVRLMHWSSGVICPVTFLMHLAAAVPVRPERVGGRRTRPCIVLAGGREGTRWEAYPHHQFLHTVGSLPCCDRGGCWKSRVAALNDGAPQDKSLCARPVTTPEGLTIPKCLDLISDQDILRAIEKYKETSCTTSTC